MADLARYDGGKNGAGVYQAIINAIPPHRVYVEAFAGSAAIYRRKSPAATSFLIEQNPAMVDRLCQSLAAVSVVCGDGMHWMRHALSVFTNGRLDGWFFYLDPPYLHSTRADKCIYGAFELDDAEHQELVTSLLPALTAAGARWALSGYRSAMYDEAAAASSWHRTDYQAQTRRGPVIESLWTNYNPAELAPAELTYYGATFRDRERVKRKAQRWAAKFSAMPDLERRFVFERLARISNAGDNRSTP